MAQKSYILNFPNQISQICITRSYLYFWKEDLILTRWFIKEICKKTSQDCLMCNQKDIALSFKLHDYRLQTCYQILIALASGITVTSNGEARVVKTL